MNTRAPASHTPASQVSVTSLSQDDRLAWAAKQLGLDAIPPPSSYFHSLQPSYFHSRESGSLGWGGAR